MTSEPSASDSTSEARGAIKRGLAWVGLATSLVAVLDLVSLVIILRLWVTKAEYGVVTTVVTVFWALELITELGLASAVIQRHDDHPDRMPTIFWLNVASGGVLYALVWFAAPWFAAMHGHEIITPLCRVMGIALVLRSFYATHQALYKKQLRFRELSLVRIVANFAEFAVKIGAAAGGLGIWCFILGPLARTVVYAVGVPVSHGWVPRLVCRPSLITEDLRFGARSSGSEIIYQAYSNLDYQIVSLYFGAAALGAYRAAYELVLEPIRFVSGVVTGVALPAFARLRLQPRAVIEQFVAFSRQNLLVVLAMVAVIVVAAGEALAVILGAEYATAAAAARVLAVVGVLRALSHLGPPLLDGLGRPDLTLRYQAIAAVVLSASFVGCAELLGGRLGYFAVALAWAIGYPLAFAALVWLMLETIGLRARDYARRVYRIPLAATIGTGAGLLTRLATGGLSDGPRLAVLAGVTLLVTFAMLAALEGLTTRAMLRGRSI